MACIREINTSYIVCGTILYLSENYILPCDCILLEGECLVDEDALTGEKVPVVKNKIEVLS